MAVSWSWVKLELDVRTFDETPFAAYLDRCRRDGIQFATMAGLGDSAEHQRSLYELNKECSADIPDRGEFYTFDEYLDRRIKVPSYDPRGVVIALDEGDWVGLAATSDWRSAGYVFNEMTGVMASHRGRGIALAMKLLGVEFARSCGVRTIRTMHHPSNAPAIALNKHLGYVGAEWDHP